MKIDIFGSCVTRDPFSLEQAYSTVVCSYLARQSFIGIDDKPVFYEENWYDGLPAWERKCVEANLTKGDSLFRFSRDSDCLIIDYIDERFDLLDLSGTRLVRTKQLLQEGFCRRYASQFRAIPRHSVEALAAWTAGAQMFLERAVARYGEGNIILHKARWAPAFLTAENNEIPFVGVQLEQVKQNNLLLAKYHDLTCRLVPGIRVIEVENEHLYADPNHKWSKEPFHYRTEYYGRFLELYQQIVGEVAR